MRQAQVLLRDEWRRLPQIGERLPPSERDSLPERWDVQFGGRVRCSDGPIGSVHGLTISPATRELTYLVVRDGLLRRRIRVVPFEMVDTADAGGVKLRPTRVAVDSETPLPSDVAEVDSVPLPRGRRAAPTITTGTRAVAEGRDVGTVALVLVDPTVRRATHVVVRRGMLGSHRLIVPMDRVVDVTLERIVLDVGLDQPVALAEYRPDADIAADVERAIEDDEIIHRLSARFLEVAVRKGVVTVTGNIATSAHRQRVEDSVRRIRGVLEVRNLAVGDDELETAVAQALGRDPRTRRFVVPVQAALGFVRLSGEVPAVAPDLARVVPGVRGVQVVASDAKLMRS